MKIDEDGVEGAGVFSFPPTPGGNIAFGIREHAMG